MAGRAWNVIFPRRILWLAVVGVLLILTSIAMDQYLIIADYGMSVAQRQADLFQPWYRNPQIVVTLLRELGFAAFIALLVAALVERVARIEQQERLDAATQLVAKNVFQAAFKVIMPTRIVNHVISSVLTARTIRSHLRLKYCVARIPAAQEAELKLSKGVYRLLHTDASFDIQNVSSGYIDQPIIVTFPMPKDSRRRSLNMLKSISIGGHQLSEAEIAEGAKAIADTSAECRFQWTKRIEPGKQCHIEVSNQLVKDISDHETFSSLLSSESIEVTVDMSCDDLEWHISPRFSGSLQPVDPPETYHETGAQGFGSVTYRSDVPILPHQGIILWWSPATDAAAAKGGAQISPPDGDKGGTPT